MDLFNIRRSFTLKTLDENEVLDNPLAMLELWVKNAIDAKALEPSAMTISTVSSENKPSSRVVLLKELTDNGLVFFTNYNSRKGAQIAANPNVAVNFIWHELERQIRIEGIAHKLSEQESEKYFQMRPRDSQIGAWASPQSQSIPDRKFLDSQVQEISKLFDSKEISKPPYWGGYIIIPSLFEFWQGRPNRLHDRIQYKRNGNLWINERLAP